MPITSQIYELALGAVRAASLAAAAVVPGDSKLARGVRGRGEAVRRLVEWAAASREPARPLAWFHAPSVGEALVAKAVIDALRRAEPRVQVAFTFFSPSAERLAPQMPADVVAYLPWDLTDAVRPAVAALAPTVLAFTKTEVWPALAREARSAGARVCLIGATLPPGAGRLRPVARYVLRPAFAALAAVAAVADDDARRFGLLGVRAGTVRVTGDPGIDSAAARVQAADPQAPYLAPFHRAPRPTVVAGSTWPADETVLLPALERVRDAIPDVRLIIAPHEPSASHVARLERDLTRDHWACARLGTVEREGRVEANAVIVDQVGVLAHLYTVGRVAYVGGGFHRAGLHSVLEPAAAGIAMTFGPGHANARAAADLLAAGAAAVCHDAASLCEHITRWLGSPETFVYAGRQGFEYISKHEGAAGRTAALIQDLMAGRDR